MRYTDAHAAHLGRLLLNQLDRSDWAFQPSHNTRQALASVNARIRGSPYPSHLDFLLRHAIHAVLTQRRFTVLVLSLSRFLFLPFALGELLDPWETCGLRACVSSSAFTAVSIMQMIERWSVQESAERNVSYASICYDGAQPTNAAMPIIIRASRGPRIIYSQRRCVATYRNRYMVQKRPADSLR